MFDPIEAYSRLASILPYLAQVAAKAAIILLIAWATVTIWPRSTAALRHRIWTLAFVGVLLVPVFIAIFPQLQIPILKVGQNSAAQTVRGVSETQADKESGLNSRVDSRIAADDLADHHGNHAAAFPFEPGTVSSGPQADFDEASTMTHTPRNTESKSSVSALVVGIWLAGVFLLLIPVVASSWLSHKVRRSALPVSSKETVSLLLTLSKAMNIGKRITIIQSKQRSVPMTWGIFRPTILLPCNWFEWTLQQQRLVLLHELAHIKRCDVLIQLIGRIASCVHWINPMAWYALHRLRIERELASDDCVLDFGERPSEYANELINLVQSYKQQRFAFGAPVVNASNLTRRVRSILAPDRSRRPMGNLLARTLLIIFAFLSIAISVVYPAARAADSYFGDKPASPARTVGTAEVTQIELQGTVNNTEGNPIDGVGVFLIKSSEEDWNNKSSIEQIATTDDQGTFSAKTEMNGTTSNSAKLIFFKRGWSLEFLDLETKQSFEVRLAIDIPVDIHASVGIGKQINRESVEIELAKTSGIPDRDQFGLIVANRSIADTIEDQVTLFAHDVPGVVSRDPEGSIKLHGLGTQKARSLEH